MGFDRQPSPINSKSWFTLTAPKNGGSAHGREEKQRQNRQLDLARRCELRDDDSHTKVP
jgi:hypothetical protein